MLYYRALDETETPELSLRAPSMELRSETRLALFCLLFLEGSEQDQGITCF